jgi:hypothetical protein
VLSRQPDHACFAQCERASAGKNNGRASRERGGASVGVTSSVGHDKALSEVEDPVGNLSPAAVAGVKSERIEVGRCGLEERRAEPPGVIDADHAKLSVRAVDGADRASRCVSVDPIRPVAQRSYRSCRSSLPVAFREARAGARRARSGCLAPLGFGAVPT